MSNQEAVASDVNEDKDKQVEEILNAPVEGNEVSSPENKMPEEHRELIQKTFKVLQDNGYTFWDAQQVTGLVMAASNTQDSVKALETANEISKLFAEEGLDKIYVSAILQIMAEKINTQINQLSMREIQID